MTDIAKNLQGVRGRIAAAARRVHREPEEVTLVAVSKVHKETSIREAYGAGQRHFGENYAQELRDKGAALADLPDIIWHFIGHLQRNKAKMVVSTGAVIETVDSLRLVAELDGLAERSSRRISCLIQVNVGEEEQKSGVAAEEATALLEGVERAQHLDAGGLMTIPPFDLNPEETREHFIALRELRDSLGGAGRLPHLSMGMSNDYEVAVEEGATLVRVGTAIFGRRVTR